MTTLTAGKVHQIAPSKISADPAQPRKSIDKAGITELAESLKAIGMKQPIVVRKDGAKVVIVYGERRWRAAKQAKLKTVPCILGDEVGTLDRAAGQIAENVQRESLSPVDLSAFLCKLQKREKKSVNELVSELAARGIKEVSHARIEKLIQMDALPKWAKAHLQAGNMSEQHGLLMLQCLEYPKVMTQLKTGVDRAVRWTGAVTLKDLQHEIASAYRHAGRDLKDTWSSNKRLFDLRVCNSCEFKKRIGGAIYCLNPAEFDRKNEEAKAMQMEKLKEHKAKAAAGEKPAPSTKAEKEDAKYRAERKEKLLEEKLVAHLDGWLRPRILACVADRATGLQVQALTYWMATGAIITYRWHGFRDLSREATEKTAPVLHAAKVGDLPSVMGYAMDAAKQEERVQGIARAAIAVMTPEQLRWFARVQLEFDLVAEGFAIDAAYLDIFRKAQLISLAKIAGLEPKGAGGVAQLKRDLLAADAVKAIGVPAHIADLYAKEPEPLDVKEFADSMPTDHEALLHELGLDSDARLEDVMQALNVQADSAAADEKPAKAAGKKAKPAA